MKHTVIAKTTKHLTSLIKAEIKINGYTCDLNHIDTSFITDMSDLFRDSIFNGDISNWDVSKVTNMSGMFWNTSFNGDISQWNTSNVTTTQAMFGDSFFNGDISHWNVNNVTHMTDTFNHCLGDKPYWSIGNNEKRKIAIENYHLMNKLNTTLNKNEKLIPFKKNKI